MQLVNILLTLGLVVLISGITILALCAVIASSRTEQELPNNNKERRKNSIENFPITCSDGTTVYFDRRLSNERRFA